LQQKTFYKILFEFGNNPTKAKQFLGDKRLTATEKKIIEGYLLIRNNQNQSALDMMKKLSPSELPFVEAQRKFIMGLALNNLSYFGEAEKMIKESLVFFEIIHAPYFLFTGNAMLFTIYSNQHQSSKMKDTLDMLESIPVESQVQVLRLLRCQFDYYSLIDEDKARAILKEIEPRKQEMTESDVISHLVCEFMFFVNLEDLDQCEIVLNDMKNYRKFNLTENFNFMKKMLAHLKTNAPIYLYGDDFKVTPMLYFQLKVIHSFEEKNFKAVEQYWAELHALYPDTYLPEFKYAGNKCLFSLAMDKHRSSYIEKVQINKVEDLSQIDSLVGLLTSSHSPLSKGHIYEYLWDEAPVDKDDFKKLTRLISRVRSERGIEIKSRKGTYFIDALPAVKKKVG
jgi:hypothetical protein